MEIRYIDSSDDKMKISKIMEDSWKYAYRGIIPQEFLDKIPRGHWSNRLESPGLYTMVCIKDGEYIGTASFGRARIDNCSDFGEIISIYLLPEYIGKGYGIKIMDSVINELRIHEYKEVILYVLEENTRARKFYERYGFELCNDDKEVIIGGKKLSAVRYAIRDIQ